MRALRSLAAVAATALLGGCAAAPPAAPQAGPLPGTLEVRGGRFTMGRDGGELNERPAHKVDVETFAIDRTEVSAAQFAEFLNAAGNAGEVFLTPDEHATVTLVREAAGGTIRFAARPGYERHPANNVSWNGADAYCRWRGQRLPTEAEWEKAARGTDKRRFPWGRSGPSGTHARFAQRWDEQGLDALVPVDALADGASPYGALNMAGNVLEWVGDWYRQNLCDFCSPEREGSLWLVREITGRDGEDQGQAPPGATAEAAGAGLTPEERAARQRQQPPRNNPSGPTEGSFKVLRGGSWRDQDGGELSTTRRFWLDPGQRFAHTGFRCALTSARAAR